MTARLDHRGTEASGLYPHSEHVPLGHQQSIDSLQLKATKKMNVFASLKMQLLQKAADVVESQLCVCMCSILRTPLAISQV